MAAATAPTAESQKSRPSVNGRAAEADVELGASRLQSAQRHAHDFSDLGRGRAALNEIGDLPNSFGREFCSSLVLRMVRPWWRGFHHWRSIARTAPPAEEMEFIQINAGDGILFRPEGGED
jgi:hypothetical protein